MRFSAGLRGRSVKALLLAGLLAGVASAQDARDKAGYDDLSTSGIPQASHPSHPEPVEPVPRPSDGKEFEYRDQQALRLAKETAEEIEDITLTVADDLDDSLSNLLLTHPFVPSVLAPVAAFSYIHLLYMSSVSRSYLVETLQLLAFACFPTLPLIQLLSNAHKTVLASFRARNTPGATLPPRTYVLAGLGGMYAFRRGETFTALTMRRRRVSEYPVAAIAALPAQSLRSFAYGFQFLIILTQLAAAGLACALTYSAPRRSDWDLATLGIDQRAWWTAVAGVIASILCLLLHLSNRSWVVGGDNRPHLAGGAPGTPLATDEKWHAAGGVGAHALPAAQSLEGVDSSLLWEGTVLSEIICAALLQDAAVAWGGGSYSLVGFLWVFLANRVVLGLLFLLGLIFNRFIRRAAARRWAVATNTPLPSGHSHSANGPFDDQFGHEALARRRKWVATLRPLFVAFSCAVCAAIIVLQLVTAAGERGVAWRDGVAH